MASRRVTTTQYLARIAATCAALERGTVVNGHPVTLASAPGGGVHAGVTLWPYAPCPWYVQATGRTVTHALSRLHYALTRGPRVPCPLHGPR